jgi:23S rRNA (adenine2503-C2)-methyltransferase
MLARDDLGECPVPGAPKDETRLVSNIVLMGMGEPLYNFDAVRDAMRVCMDNEGLSLSRRRITLSTSGVVPEIARTAEEIGCQLAVSFHATTDEVRNVLVRSTSVGTSKPCLTRCAIIRGCRTASGSPSSM